VVDILFDISYLCIAALQNGFLLRGAIVCDKVFHRERKIFGPALVKAYEMESKKAIYPRIILDDGIIDIAREHHSRSHSPDWEVDFIKEGMIMQDSDGLYFIDYFYKILSELDDYYSYLAYLDRLRKIIIEGLKTKKRIKKKYLWMKKKYNFTIAKHKNDYKSGLNKGHIMAECPEWYDYFKKIKKL